MNKIYMLFSNYRFKLIIINVDSKLMSIEDKVFHIDEEEKKILEIINSLSNGEGRSVMDPVRFSITNDKNGEITSFDGTSNTCKEFSEIDEWIGDMYDRYV